MATVHMHTCTETVIICNCLAQGQGSLIVLLAFRLAIHILVCSCVLAANRTTLADTVALRQLTIEDHLVHNLYQGLLIGLSFLPIYYLGGLCAEKGINH